MAKPEQVLLIEPQNELKFRGPFNVPVTSYMKLTNPSDKKVLFKIKTTAPKKYCVRPNSGLLDPSSNIEIAICLQPFIFDPAEKNKHKFMVQTVYAPDSDASVDKLWKNVGADQMMDSKLKCVFEFPPDQNDAGGAGNATAGHPDDTLPVGASPKAQATPAQNAISSVPPLSAGGAPLSLESELDKAAQEVQLLREEESSLRQENLRLKEEILKLKRSASGGGLAGSPPLSKYTPMVSVQQQGISVVNLFVCVSVAIFGIILGKFIL